MKTLFDELELEMIERHNANFRIETLDICTKLAIKTLCDLIEQRLTPLPKRGNQEDT